MRLHGWCERCHKIKMVTVRIASLHRGGVPTGICSACEEAQR